MADPQKAVPIPTGSTIEPVPIPQGASIEGEQPQAQGKGWLGNVADFAGGWWDQVNPISGVKGTVQAIAHPIDTVKALGQAQYDVEQRAEKAFKEGNYAEGVGHVLNAILPVIGPALERAEDVYAQNPAAGLGQIAGVFTNLLAPEALGAVKARLPVGNLPERIYESVLKPGPKTFTTAERASMVKTGLEEGILPSPKGIDKMSNLVSDLNDKVKARIAAGSQAGVTIDPYAVASRTDETLRKFSNQVVPQSDIESIIGAKQNFLRSRGETKLPSGQILTPASPMTAEQAQAIKVGTYSQLRKKYGELSSAEVEAEKALARGIKEELETPFPEIKELNARESKLLGLDDALQTAVHRIQNRELFGLTGTIVAAGAGAVGGSVLGGAGGAVEAAAALGILHKIVNDPVMQSRLAIAMTRARKGITISQAKARIAAYSNGIGNMIDQANQPQGQGQ